jgi:YfiH family protein
MIKICEPAQLTPIAPGIARVDGFFPKGITALQTDRLGGSSGGDFSTFNLGDHVGDDPLRVARNRRQLSDLCPSQPIWLEQIHGTQAIALDEPDLASMVNAPARKFQADASMTRLAGQVCCVMTADCLPLLVARPGTGQVAAIHAGWRGLLAGVIEKTLTRMSQFEPKGDDLWKIWLGPAIGASAFEVGGEVRDQFTSQASISAQAFVSSSSGADKWLADLRRLAVGRIQAWADQINLESQHSSVQIEIAIDPQCVYTRSDRYFSYRRDGKTGRMASLIFRD